MLSSQSGEEIDYGSPDAFFVFIVGNCEEWPENRVEQGDIALYDEYLAAGVPPDQIVYVKDRKTTNKNCEKQLLAFLKRTRPLSTLVFYYGGHGEPTGFHTQKAEWSYQDVTSIIESYFQGERVIYLLDCCASGNLARWLSPPYTVSKQYVSLSNAPPFVEASDDGEEWVLTLAWIRGMRCSDGNLPLARVIECATDRMAQVLGDQATTYVSAGVDCTRGDWMPRRQPEDITGTLDWNKLENHIPKDARVTSRWSVGNCVFYKHPGGPFKPGSEYLPPGWLSATILAESDDDGSVQLQVFYPMNNLKWKVETPRSQLMNDFYMGQMWMLPDEFEKAQCVLARNFKYLDYSLEANTMVKACDKKDGEVYPARVLDWRYFDWEAYLDSDDCNQEAPFGAHVPIQWLHKDDTALIPVQTISSPSVTERVFLDDSSESSASIKGNEEALSRRALVWSIESSGKTICDARKVGSKLSAFWPEDEEWYGVKPLDPSTVPLKVLASHAKFTLKGEYCPLAYDDGEVHLSPMFYVQKRKARPCC